jgi:arylsulfatase A-like enzyme
LFQTPVPDGESYPGFFERVAAQVRRIDRCFGGFVGHLKRLGLYDRSIIVLTSDHGDSLGEEGRFGHSYTLFPEVMRVPLIIKLPASMAGAATDLTRVSFTTDITPTLYALLGYEPEALGPRNGAPLFGKTPDEDARRRDPFLLSSSYGAVYGMLRHNGRALYIADAVEGRDYAYDLSDGGLGHRVQITDAMRELNWRLIREEVARIADQYNFNPEP